MVIWLLLSCFPSSGYYAWLQAMRIADITDLLREPMLAGEGLTGL